ncbi:ABC transporter permease [Patescibacteria group bacterium]
MNLLNPIKISFKNLMAAKTRSFLTILGVIIGVSAVIVIFAIGKSAQELILDQVRGIGSNLIGVLPGSSDESGPPAAVMGISITTLTYEDLQALKNKRNIPEIEDVAGYVMGTASVSYEDTDLGSSVTGTTESYIDVENTEVIKGRFFTESEERGGSRVAVLGVSIAKDLGLYEGDIESAHIILPKKMKIGDQNYSVIGIFKERGSAAFGVSSQDDTIFVPLKTAQKLILGINHLGFIRVKVESTEAIDRAKIGIENVLRDRHDIDNPSEDDFSVRDQESAIEMIGNITDVLRYFLLAIGTIALIVGGVGIMNIMLIAVNQRVHEIGLRKAIGARESDVLTQFVIESATISFVGGVIGIIFGVFVSFIISIIAKSAGYNWMFIISPWSIIIAVSVSVLIGIVFGLWPANKASKISPMEALRHE